MLDLAPQLLRLRVRKLAEAKQFYTEIVGATLQRESAEELHLSLDHSTTIVCTFAPELGEQGRVAESYQLSDGKYALISQRLNIRREHWRIFSRALKRNEYRGVHRVFDESTKHSARRCVCVLDPSGNPLEISLTLSRAQRAGFRLLSFLWLGMSATLIALLAYAAISARDQAVQGDAYNTPPPSHQWP